MPSFFSSDIQKLNTLYNRPSFSFVFLYGRHGTGKTTLLRDFCQNKRTLFFSAQETVPEHQLFLFWQETIRFLQLKKQPAQFQDWAQAFSFVAEYSFTHRLVLVLDEFQTLAQQSPEFMQAFIAAVRHNFVAGKIFLIITSSSPAYAQEVLLEEVREPFDAVTARAAIISIPFYSCQSRLAQYLPMDQMLLYGVTGGLPSYLNQLDPDRSATDNIIRMFFRYDSPLLADPLTLLRHELREISTYNQLLTIMASGCSRLADIADAADIGTNKCAKYLNALIALGVIRKEYPAWGELQKKVRYVFADHMLRFWYRFVYPNLSAILFGKGPEIFQETVRPQLGDYLTPVFETICAEYLENLASTGQTPFVYRHTGSWWTGGTKREPYFRIPLVAMDRTHIVLGSCHCAGTPANLDMLQGLQKHTEQFGTLQQYCCLFSTSGFSRELTAAAERAGNIWLIDLEDAVPHVPAESED